jgi:dipeptidase D
LKYKCIFESNMLQAIRNIEPIELWNNFADLNAVPRPSKKEEKVIQFIKTFGERLGLPTMVDDIGNVIIKKPATAGKEGSPTVILQSHLDMVHQKNAETNFDFSTQGIEMLVAGDWIKANGTTLGADNGIGVASIMSILASSNIAHPAIEALFTIDEETGMTGALGLKGGLLDGRILLNLDTEDDNELTIGCAGGVDVTATGTYNQTSANGIGYKIVVKGLTGGHSGMDIHKGRGNANKLMNRILTNLNKLAGIQISSIDGGSLRNAIPRESVSEFIVPIEKEQLFLDYMARITAELRTEYASTDSNLEIKIEKNENSRQVMATEFQNNILAALYACPNGIYRMSPEIEGLVQTSNNLARVLIKDGSYSIQCLTRSSVDSEKGDLAEGISQCFSFLNSTISLGGSYPGWSPQPNSNIVKLMRKIYQDRFKEEPHVNACHAGLECGILSTNYSGMEMISFGPNIRGAHSPDETVQISSVQKYWGYLLEVLNTI